MKQNWILQRAVERELQVLVEIVIDICQRLIAVSGQAPATSGRDAIQRCQQLGVLTAVAPYEQMVQLRNIIVHRYDYVDAAILVNIVNNHLPDLQQFRDEVLANVQDD